MKPIKIKPTCFPTWFIGKCGNCNEDFDIRVNKNKHGVRIGGECEQCGWRFKLNQQDIDFIQPNNPFWEIVYGALPEKQYAMNKKKTEWEKEQGKIVLEKKYFERYKDGRKPWEKKAILKEVLEG